MKNVRINNTPSNINKTIKLMQDAMPQAIKQTKAIADGKYFKVHFINGKPSKATIKRLYTWLRKNYSYGDDPVGKEYIRLPLKSWQDRRKGIDCEDFSLIVAAVLYQWNVSSAYRIVGYENNYWSHIYVVIPWSISNEYLVVDVVHEQFNYEDEFMKRKDFKTMPKQLAGVQEDLAIAELEYFIQRKAMDIRGYNTGWFGFQTKKDKEIVAKLDRQKAKVRSLRKKAFNSYPERVQLAGRLKRKWSKAQ